jgi:hypothetical protein
VWGVPYPYHNEQAIYGECEERLNRELEVIGAERASRDRGSHGSCRFCARGFDTASLKEAALRALGGWRVPARFNISLEDQFDREGGPLVEQFEVSGDAA